MARTAILQSFVRCGLRALLCHDKWREVARQSVSGAIKLCVSLSQTGKVQPPSEILRP